jgi:hypothetical protein
MTNAHKPTQDLEYDDYLYSNKIVVAKSLSAQFQSLSDGVAKEESIPWTRWVDGDERLFAALLRRIVIEKDSGTATTLDWAIGVKSGATGVEIVASGSGVGMPVDTDLSLKEWVSEETTDKNGLLFVKLTPHGGGGNFTVRVFAEPKK